METRCGRRGTAARRRRRRRRRTLFAPGVVVRGGTAIVRFGRRARAERTARRDGARRARKRLGRGVGSGKEKTADAAEGQKRAPEAGRDWGRGWADAVASDVTETGAHNPHTMRFTCESDETSRVRPAGRFGAYDYENPRTLTMKDFVDRVCRIVRLCTGLKFSERRD